MTETKTNEPVLATGRRKTSVAQVRMVPNGQGKISVNAKTIDEYFGGRERLKTMIASPMAACANAKIFDYFVKVEGGGIVSQAGAIRHGLARALTYVDVTNKKPLKKAGFLTRDPRMVERKKPGRPKARKRFQYSKR